MGKNAPRWAIEAAKIMIDRNLTKRDIARALNKNYTTVCNVMNGYINNDSLESEICAYLKMER